MERAEAKCAAVVRDALAPELSGAIAGELGRSRAAVADVRGRCTLGLARAAVPLPDHAAASAGLPEAVGETRIRVADGATTDRQPCGSPVDCGRATRRLRRLALRGRRARSAPRVLGEGDHPPRGALSSYGQGDSGSIRSPLRRHRSARFFTPMPPVPLRGQNCANALFVGRAASLEARGRGTTWLSHRRSSWCHRLSEWRHFAVTIRRCARCTCPSRSHSRRSSRRWLRPSVRSTRSDRHHAGDDLTLPDADALRCEVPRVRAGQASAVPDAFSVAPTAGMPDRKPPARGLPGGLGRGLRRWLTTRRRARHHDGRRKRLVPRRLQPLPSTWSAWPAWRWMPCRGSRTGRGAKG